MSAGSEARRQLRADVAQPPATRAGLSKLQGMAGTANVAGIRVAVTAG
jgi:hypothetical protein